MIYIIMLYISLFILYMILLILLCVFFLSIFFLLKVPRCVKNLTFPLRVLQFWVLTWMRFGRPFCPLLWANGVSLRVSLSCIHDEMNACVPFVVQTVPKFWFVGSTLPTPGLPKVPRIPFSWHPNGLLQCRLQCCCPLRVFSFNFLPTGGPQICKNITFT